MHQTLICNNMMKSLLLRYTLISITLAGCASNSTTNHTITKIDTAKIDPNNVGLSIQYSLTEQEFKVKPFYSPSAQEAIKPNFIKSTPSVNPSASADPSNPPLNMNSEKPTLETTVF